jgi:aquaporin Z
MGLAMGATAIAIIYSPWGKQSGAHINPSTTFTFYRLGKITRSDAFFYIVCQFTGGLTGAIIATNLFSDWAAHPSVYYAITAPGPSGVVIAFIAELAITFILMTVILHVSNNVRWHRFTGLCAGPLVAAYISLEAPLSGMSMNPARTLASAVPAQRWTRCGFTSQRQ